MSLNSAALFAPCLPIGLSILPATLGVKTAGASLAFKVVPCGLHLDFASTRPPLGGTYGGPEPGSLHQPAGRGSAVWILTR